MIRALALSLLLSAAPLAAQVPAAGDTPGKTASGVVFMQPKDWTMTVKGAATTFSAPEASLRIAVVDVGGASDAKAAASRAWGMVEPSFARAIRLVTPIPAGDGWDERAGVSYETSPEEKRVVAATALRRGSGWTVLLIDGSEAIANKRSSALALLGQSLRPAGYKPESFAGRVPHRLNAERIQLLRDFVAESAKTLDVPGVGFALIDQGKVVWQGGYGVREKGKTDAIDAHTKFMVASNTKGMSTLLLSVLADEGKLRWDQKVVDLYPAFRLGSDETTRATEVRHLVCACTGLPRKDFAFILADGGAPASDTFRQLGQSYPTSKFGELFQYNNLMASAAGYLGGSLAYPRMEVGAAFDKAMQTRIFGPLGMRDTTFDLAVGERGDWARPHGTDLSGKTVEISNAFNHLITPHRPAGGVWSSTADMARYAQLELSQGVSPEGKRIVSVANILERRRKGVAIGENAWYGMGLIYRIEADVPIVTHGGTLQGFHSNFFVIPDAGIGAVILTNSDSGASMLAPVMRRVLEVVYDGKPEAAAEVMAAAARLKAGADARRARVTVPGDPAVFAGLAKVYRSPDGATIAFRDVDGQLWAKAGFIEGPVGTRKNPDGSFSIVSSGAGSIPLDAAVGMKDGTKTLTVRDSQHEYVYGEVR